MPKNKKPQGGRPARNFEPRFAAKKTSFHDRHHGAPSSDGERGGRADSTERRSSPAAGGYDRRPGSRSAGHRGHRPVEAESGAPKQRWSAQERAGRDEARGIRNRAESGRREAPHHRDERPRTSGGADRPRYTDRPAAGSARRFDDRPRRDDRGAGSYRSSGDARQRYERNSTERPTGAGTYRDDRAGQDRGQRPSTGTGNYRGGGSDRPRFDRNASERPRSDRDERPNRSFDGDRARRAFDRDRLNRSFDDSRDERPRPSTGSGAHRDAAGRPRFDRDARPNRDDRGGERTRPSTGGAYRTDRPRFDRDERPRRDASERPRFDRDERPRRDDRGSDRPRFDRTSAERPRFDRDDRPRRDASDRPRRDSNDRPRREDRPTRDNWDKSSKAKTEQTEDVVHERLEAQSIEAVAVDGVSFGDLGLGSNIVETLNNMGAASPFAIQAASIPAVLEGRDVLARGRTGSGKTIAFGAPLVENVLKSQAGKRREFGRSPRAIILAPTRELALQIDRTIQPIARSVGLFTTQIYGGVPQGRQVGALKKGVDIIIGTPGRVEDLINQGKLDLSDCRIAVLDEADHMCELGFVEPVQRILRHTAEGSQKLLFSATLDREVAALVDEFLVDPAVFEVAGEDQDSSTIEHRVLVIEHRDKAEILTSLVDRAGKTLVFARTRAYADMLAEQFDDAGIPAVSLHGDLNQAKRTRNLERLTSGRVNVLVATDVAARGIHVDDIDLVVQADAPDEYKTYLHRSGRTGRAGRSGRVVTLITRQRQRRMTELLDRAEIDAPFENARIDDDILEEITGRAPSAADLTA
ncbi:DEAD/DEAH box helicase [Microbacterium sp. LTA6]|uniref:DEAD/DEAH box helicase n=1 Tax=Microbacterium sp. LTA6 TaxID=3129771 RepID=UPI00324FAE84